MPLNDALLSATIGAHGCIRDAAGPWASLRAAASGGHDGAALDALIRLGLERDGLRPADPQALADACSRLAAPSAAGGQAMIPLAGGGWLIITADAQPGRASSGAGRRLLIHRAAPLNPAAGPVSDPASAPVPGPSPAVLQQVIDAIPAAISIKDAARRYLYVNQAWEACYGIDRRAITGGRFEEASAGNVTADTFRVHAADVGSKDSTVLRTGIPILDQEETFVDREGRRRTWLNSKIPLHGDSRGFGALLSITLDITARKEAELALEQAKADAEHASHLKNEFLSIVSHELRTPLNAIIGFTQLCRTMAAPAPIPDYLGIIEQAAGTLTHLIEDILDLSRIEMGRFALQTGPVPVRQLIGEVLAIAGPLLCDRDVAIEARIDDTVPEHADGDHRRLRQVLLNLLNNAIKFTPQGRITVACSLGTDGGDLVFVVEDTGIGIPADQHDRIFEPFTQVENAGRRIHGGLGLGLSICRRLVEQMGGRIGVASDPGRGSRFWFTLPLQSDAGASADAVAAASHGRRA